LQDGFDGLEPLVGGLDATGDAQDTAGDGAVDEAIEHGVELDHRVVGNELVAKAQLILMEAIGSEQGEVAIADRIQRFIFNGLFGHFESE
jgi:hypothetical protein